MCDMKLKIQEAEKTKVDIEKATSLMKECEKLSATKTKLKIILSIKDNDFSAALISDLFDFYKIKVETENLSKIIQMLKQ